MLVAIRCVSRRALVCSRRFLCTEVPPGPFTDGEQQIISKLKISFPKATFVNAKDTGGGCGTMYSIQVEAEEFRGKRLILQHRMINEALREELVDVHGVTIETKIPEQTSS